MYNNGNSSKNVTGASVVDGTLENADFADNGLSGDKIDGGTISNFTSTGIDDNATSTAITIDASENVTVSNNITFSKTTGAVSWANGKISGGTNYGDLRNFGDRIRWYNLAGTTKKLELSSDNYLRMSSGTGGIQFNGDTAAANALDDYEEGTFTPTFLLGGGNTGMTGTFTGRYTKVGDMVTIYVSVSLTAKGSSTGVVTMGGLPFTGGSGFVAAPSIVNLSFADTLFMQLYPGTVIYFFETTNAGNRTQTVDSNVSDNTSIVYSTSYFI